MKKFKTGLAAAAALVGAVLAASVARRAAEPVSIVAFGDSLTRRLRRSDPANRFPSSSKRRSASADTMSTVANAGVSGDTASDGLARLEWSVPAEADIVIVELGANDALRGIDPAVTREALAGHPREAAGARPGGAARRHARAAQSRRRICRRRSMRSIPSSPPNTASPLYPFFLEGVATDAALNQPDGMHPTAAGVARIVEGDPAGCGDARDGRRAERLTAHHLPS